MYPSFINLLEKFNPLIGEEDADLSADIEAFLDVLLETDCMKITQEYLAEWGNCFFLYLVEIMVHEV